MAEEWRDIPSYEGEYQVSDQGRVRSLDRSKRAVSKAGQEYFRTVKGKVLAPGKSRGYLIVNLAPNGTVAIQIVVAQAFLPPRPTPLHEINHADGNKHNNRVCNLEWMTKSQNQIHAVQTGLRAQACRVTDGKTVWASQSQAAFELTGSRRRGSEISRVLRGERLQALGRVWLAA